MAYIGRPSIVGNFVKLDAISVVNGQAAYTMQNSSANFTDYSSVNQFMVSLNGTIQSPGSSFTVSGSTITFASNLVTNDVIDFIIVFGNSLSSGVPTDATVSTAKIVDANVTTAKVADDAITAAKLNNDIISGSTELASEPADTDEFLVSDAGTLKRIDYSYIKPSSNFVKLTSGTISSGTSALELEFFSSSYNFYHFYFENVYPSSAAPLRFRLRDSSGNLTESKYKYSFAHPYASSGTTGINAHGGYGNDYINWGNNSVHTDQGQGANGIIHFSNTHQSNKRPFFFGQKVATEGGTQVDAHNGGGFYDKEVVVVGFSMYFQSYTISAGNYALYGVKS